MNILQKTLSVAFLGSVLLTSCKKNDNPHEHPHEDSKQEYRFVRLLVSDGQVNTISQISPIDGTVATFQAKHPNASLFATAGKRFAGLVYGSENFVEFFDTGLELHGDHADVKGTPKFAAITASGVRPAHFKSRGNETVIFNDGEGTLSAAHETEFHTIGATMRVIETGIVAHHGAMAQFDNGTYAVTQPDATSDKGGPHGVRIIDANGNIVHESSVPVVRIHGNATDGKNAVFGCEGGVLVVKDNGEQRIIGNPGDWGTVRLGTILEAKSVNKFIGFVAAKGAYFVDIVNERISPIIEATNIVQCKVDYAGKNLLILQDDGNLKIFNLGSGSLVKEAKVTDAIPSTDTFKPVVEGTEKFVYIALPTKGEVLQISTADLSDKKSIAVTSQPSRLVVLGFETSEGH